MPNYCDQKLNHDPFCLIPLVSVQMYQSNEELNFVSNVSTKPLTECEFDDISVLLKLLVHFVNFFI